MRNGCWQVPLDHESTLLTTFNTPFGRYKWNRMPFGISPIGECFQRRLDQAIEGLTGVWTVADDILAIGNGATSEDAERDHDAKMEALLERCRARHIKLNLENIEVKRTSMPYMPPSHVWRKCKTVNAHRGFFLSDTAVSRTSTGNSSLILMHELWWPPLATKSNMAHITW